MSELVFGDVDWNSADTGDSGGSRVEFMRLTEGANVVRVLGNPQQFYVNWLVLPDGKKRKVNTPDSPELARRLEDAGFKRQAKWFVKILDRKDNQFKLLEIGRQIFTAVQDLYNNPKWGKVTNYDLTINRGSPGKQPLYSVQPDPKEPLDSTLSQAFTEFNESLNLERLLSPSDPEYICELMGWEVLGGVTGGEESDPFASDSSEGTSEGTSEFDYDFD